MQYGLNHVWLQGDEVTRVIALILALMSVLSWATIFFKGAQLARFRRQSRIAERRFWQASDLETAQASLGRHQVVGNPYRELVEAGREAHEGHGTYDLGEMLSPDQWLQRCLGIALEEQFVRLARGLGVLASVGSTAPFVGLFGTVWGIYHALLTISVAGQSNLAQVAGPVGESLVMTAAGLAVAIPAVLGYNAIARGNKGVAAKLKRFCHDLHAFLMSGAARRPGAHSAVVASTMEPALKNVQVH
ncbi:MotA/TolQ/ExbB proton channel family protein [Burkholderia anthina]|uniref:MotA/TolQ/ExbB proton channel family protein n=1 Tax=Burkholderia anthina TaxID=179879 RepID=UPI001CF1D8BD|nr:MotA/TolQ/ExbB proton channel family protein [Burkholderia anthina]MCA8095240.1 MotA/TolQ/ExbB proton channel family protein [Burkholderia anthina]